jgi:hypothetical protein
MAATPEAGKRGIVAKEPGRYNHQAMELTGTSPSCTGHPGVAAQGPCLSCGRWACDVCALPAVAGIVCPVCASEHMPWEERGRLGFWRGFTRTLIPSLISPEDLFGRLRRQGRVAPALGYAMVTNLLGASTAAVLSVSGGFGIPPAAITPGDRLFSALILLGFVSLLWLAADVLLAALIHGALSILGEAQATFGTTVRAVCYGGGAGVLYATIVLPALFIPQVWATLSTIQAIRLSHRTTPARATTAVLVPTLACMIAGLTALKVLAPAMLAMKQ